MTTGNWDMSMMSMTRERIDQMFRAFDNVRDTFLGEYLMPTSTPFKERACYVCKRRVYISHYLKNGGTEKQWNDDHIQILCCSCLNLTVLGYGNLTINRGEIQ